jgi:hypothetical protein
MSYDVFISYVSEDRPFADALCDHLEKKGIRCWIDHRNLLPGFSWRQGIVEAIEGNPNLAMVLLFSSRTNESHQVMKEIDLADENNMMVIPVRIENVMPTGELKLELRRKQWLDAFEDMQAVEKVAERILESISLYKNRRGATQPSTEGERIDTLKPSTELEKEVKEKTGEEPSEDEDDEDEVGGTGEKVHWNEELFFKELDKGRGAEVSRIEKKILEWANQNNEIGVKWTFGKVGGFIPSLKYKGELRSLFKVGVKSRAVVAFKNWYLNKPPFDSESKGKELVNQINLIPGMAISTDHIPREINVPLSKLKSEDALKQFLHTFDWVIQEIKAS